LLHTQPEYEIRITDETNRESREILSPYLKTKYERIEATRVVNLNEVYKKLWENPSSLKVRSFVICKQDVDSNAHFYTQNFVSEKKGQSRIYRFDKMRQDSCISEGDYVVINNLDDTESESSFCDKVCKFVKSNWVQLVILIALLAGAAGLIIYFI
jgi:hypothetical protein